MFIKLITGFSRVILTFAVLLTNDLIIKIQFDLLLPKNIQLSQVKATILIISLTVLWTQERKQTAKEGDNENSKYIHCKDF